jgi:hypothetical protein
MKIPFSQDQFFSVFEAYNVSLWPIQILFTGLGIVCIIVVVKNGLKNSRILFSILSFFWLWMGAVYHILYFSSINRAAYLFGSVFIVQGLVFLYFGAIKQKIQFNFNLDLSGITGLVLIVHALVAYPMISYFVGHVYPRSPTFGVPCPTTIFTFGLLLFSTTRVPWFMILVPLLWSLIGFSAALNLSVTEDFGLAVAGVLATPILLFYKPIGQTKK